MADHASGDLAAPRENSPIVEHAAENDHTEDKSAPSSPGRRRWAPAEEQVAALSRTVDGTGLDASVSSEDPGLVETVSLDDQTGSTQDGKAAPTAYADLMTESVPSPGGVLSSTARGAHDGEQVVDTITAKVDLSETAPEHAHISPGTDGGVVTSTPARLSRHDATPTAWGEAPHHALEHLLDQQPATARLADADHSKTLGPSPPSTAREAGTGRGRTPGRLYTPQKSRASPITGGNVGPWSTGGGSSGRRTRSRLTGTEQGLEVSA